jgi:hypothetical protein
VDPVLAVFAVVVGYFLFRAVWRAARINAIYGDRFDSWGLPIERDL